MKVTIDATYEEIHGLEDEVEWIARRVRAWVYLSDTDELVINVDGEQVYP